MIKQLEEKQDALERKRKETNYVIEHLQLEMSLMNDANELANLETEITERDQVVSDISVLRKQLKATQSTLHQLRAKEQDV